MDAHSWRQVTNADIARNWVEGPIQFAYPVVSWGGPDGRVGLEFPLLHLLTALVWRAVGLSDPAGRLVAVAFSVSGVWLMGLLGSRLFGRPAGRGAAFLLAVSPSVVYFGRTLLSDTPMLTFSIGAVLGYVAYVQTTRWPYALAGALSLAMAGLVKLPAILVLGPVLWAGFLARRWSVLRDPWFTAAPLAAMGAVAAWYVHADLVYQSTGLTQAIFRPSGTYPQDIAAYAGPFLTVSHWTRAELLTLQNARELGFRYYALHLTPAGTLLAVLGMARWRQAGRTLVDIWMLAALSLVAVSLAGQIPHEFHQLPTLPPIALYFGLGAAPLFSGATYARLGRWRVPATAVVAVGGLALSVYAFWTSGAVRYLYRPDRMNFSLVDAGRAIDAATPRDVLLVVMEYSRYGANSPMLLYYAHRRGWSFDASSITPEVVEHLRRDRGVRFFATSEWSSLETMQPAVVEYLSRQRAVDLPGIAWEFRLFELSPP